MAHQHHAPRSLLHGRLRFIARRLLRSAIGYFVAIVCIAAVVNATMEATVRSQLVEAAQGAVLAAGQLASAEEAAALKRQTIARMEKSLGLDKPGWVRILARAWAVMRLDLGSSRSTMTNYPLRSRLVLDIIKERSRPTLVLFASSTLIAIALGTWLGTAMAAKPGGRLDRGAGFITMLVYGTPSWWLGTFFVLAFVYVLPVFKIGALRSPESPPGLVAAALDYLSYLALPLITLVFIKLWSFAYMTRAMVVVPMQEDFVVAARGRGIPERAILTRHGLRTAAPGVMTMASQALAQSIGGDILLERVMTRPGLGTTLFSALGVNDIPLITGIMAVLTAIYCLSYALLDISYGILDPRMAYGSS